MHIVAASLLAAARCGGEAPAAQVAEPLRVALLFVGLIKVESALSLESYRARVIEPLRASGYSVDVFSCQLLHFKDSVAQRVLENRLAPLVSFNISVPPPPSGCHHAGCGAPAAALRQEVCFQRVLQRGKHFDWFIRARLDLSLWSSLPDLATLDTSFIHARLRGVRNFPEPLTSADFSHWNKSAPCCPGCVCDHVSGSCPSYGARNDTYCAMYDDELALVPDALADAYFLLNSSEADRHFRRFPSRVRLPGLFPCALPADAWPEGSHTQKVHSLGGRFKVLRLDARLTHRASFFVPDRTDVVAEFRC